MARCAGRKAGSRARTRPGQLKCAAMRAASAQAASSGSAAAAHATAEAAALSVGSTRLPLSLLPFASPSTPLRVRYSVDRRNRRITAGEPALSSGHSAAQHDSVAGPHADATPAPAASAASLLERPAALWLVQQRCSRAAAQPLLPLLTATAGEQHSGPIARPAGMLGATALRSQAQQHRLPRPTVPPPVTAQVTTPLLMLPAVGAPSVSCRALALKGVCLVGMSCKSQSTRLQTMHVRLSGC